MPDDDDDEPAITDLGVPDVLDLHAFHPRDVATLVPDWLDECAARGLGQVRVIHGKGAGTLRRIVHAALARHPAVLRYGLAGDGAGHGGGWGATVITLRRGPARDID